MLTTTDLLARLAEEYQSIADNVVHGKCRTIEDYRAECARLRMLEHVQSVAQGQEKKSESSADQDSS